MSPEKETFHVVIRIPTKRPKGFAEPPSIVWTDEMEHKLWQYMSQKKTDWTAIAEQLGVPTSYIVRHAAFIYETQLRGIHQQLRLNGNTTNMSRNSAKSPTPSMKRPASIRYSNTFQYQQQQPQPQQQPQQPQDNIEPTHTDTPSFSSGNALRLSPLESTDLKPSQSPSESLHKSTLGRVHTDNSVYIKEDSSDDDNGRLPADSEEEEEEGGSEEKEGKSGGDEEEEEEEEERFSSHFERLKFEEPAFLPRRVEGSTGSLSTNRHQLSLSIQNLRKANNSSSSNGLGGGGGGESSTSSPKRLLSPQTHSPITRASTAPGSNNESAINSSTSSFSDISETSVTQSAMEDAFLSNFGNGGGSKLSSFMSFSRK